MLNTLAKSFSAGILIAIGGSVFLATENRVAGSVLFSVALLSICYLGLFLFTGKIGFFPEDVSLQNAARLTLGLCGNLTAAFLSGLLIRDCLPSLGERAHALFSAKLEESFGEAFVRALFCGILMYVAVTVFRDKKTPIGILFCVPVFILCGFEHSIADMFYFGASGIFRAQAVVFFLAAVLGNAAGSMILPLLNKIGEKRNETE